ncbi:MAG: hypothetical protein IT458_19755 [Planctomycetes bacterium]|nr:hypothetical protein [Planctomycetota bacterium]
MASFWTHRGIAELQSFGFRGVGLNGSTLAGFHVLLVRAGTLTWRESETVGSVAIDLPPGVAYSTGFLPRSPGTWSIAAAGGSTLAVQARVAAPVAMVAAQAFDLAGVALALGTAPSDPLLAVLDLPRCAVSPRQTLAIAGASIGLGPVANGTAFATSAGTETLLHLALNGATPGGTPSAWGVGLIGSAFTPPAHPGGWSLTHGDVSPHLIAAGAFDRALEVPRAAGAWSITPGTATTAGVAKPTSPMTFAYVGGQAVEVASLALFAGLPQIAEPMLLVALDATHELLPGATVSLAFGGSQP